MSSPIGILRKQLGYMNKGHNRDTTTGDSERVSIFSFTKRNSLLNFILFVILVYAYAAILFFVFPSKLGEEFFRKLTNIISYISTFIPVAIVLVLSLDLGGAILMILIGWVKDRKNKEREEQIDDAVNRAIGAALSEAQAKIDLWNARRMQAEQEGENFSEPLNIFSDNRQNE